MQRPLRVSLLCLLAWTACDSEPHTGGPPPDESDAGNAGESGPPNDDAREGDDAREADEVPGDWQRVQGSCGVSLQAPSLIASPARGIDSCIGSFAAPGCTYSLDVGGFSDPLRGYRSPDFSVESVRVADHVARLVTSNGAPGTNSYFVGIHFPAPLWPGGSSVSATIVAQCTAPGAQETARLALQTIQLPADGAATIGQPEETSRCVGDDIRPVTGYRLGRSCVEARVDVPGTCALGAKINGTTGNGPMVCFVSKAGDYYWAHVAFGETVAGTGSRRGGGEVIGASQLEPAEDAKCEELVAMLGEAQKPLHGGDLSYQACP